jgi:5'-3' exonuclease
MQVHVIDGTFELFRAFYGPPGRVVDGVEVGATHALVRNFAAWLRSGELTHAGVAFDTVIESFRNTLFDGYKTGDGVDPNLMAQFPLAEEACAALGLVVWGMIDFEADDALATAAARLADDPAVERVVIATPDKDMSQCVVGDRVVTLDRMRGNRLDEAGVIAKFGVPPSSIPDLLALVGDEADGVPGLPKWGMRSAAAVLARWKRIEDIPDDPSTWQVTVRGAAALADVLRARRADAMLYRTLTTLRRDAPIECGVDHLAWRGIDQARWNAIAPKLGFVPGDLVLTSRP